MSGLLMTTKRPVQKPGRCKGGCPIKLRVCACVCAAALSLSLSLWCVWSVYGSSSSFLPRLEVRLGGAHRSALTHAYGEGGGGGERVGRVLAKCAETQCPGGEHICRPVVHHYAPVVRFLPTVRAPSLEEFLDRCNLFRNARLDFILFLFVLFCSSPLRKHKERSATHSCSSSSRSAAVFTCIHRLDGPAITRR